MSTVKTEIATEVFQIEAFIFIIIQYGLALIFNNKHPKIYRTKV
jgi:hypothetical protein